MKRMLGAGDAGNLGKWAVKYSTDKNYNVAILTSGKNSSPENSVFIFNGDLSKELLR